MKIFLDTNIILDLILQRDNYKESLLILNSVSKKVFDGFILDITILNVDYIAKKQIKEIRLFLDELNKTLTVLGADNSIFTDAINIQNSDLEDNVQYVSAQQMKCDIIITNDKKFYSPDIKVLNSKEFVKTYL